MYAHTSINALHFIAHANFLEPMQSSHHHVMGNLLFPPQQFMHDGLYPAQSRVLPPPGSGAGPTVGLCRAHRRETPFSHSLRLFEHSQQ